ncbi:MAG: hypothetical protein CMQ45_10720 [Gammaproteobacteria bacterium]|nr:hypothetical protein [Gammaproteobacteria bacterium]|tara:strand:+ start:300 stop:641 length:342 start_codon:yes stop_codon:yes gene_type:complete
MTTNTSSINSTYDFASMAALKKGATGSLSERRSAGKEVAKEFEAEFIRLVTSAMQKASEPLKSDLLSSNSLDFYQEMFYSELGHFLAQKGTLGVADFINEAIEFRDQTGGQET